MNAWPNTIIKLDDYVSLKLSALISDTTSYDLLLGLDVLVPINY